MSELEKLRDEAIKLAEEDAGKKFKMKPAIRWGDSWSHTHSLQWQRDKDGKVTKVVKADVIIDKYFAKEKFKKLLRTTVLHEVREMLAMQTGDSAHNAHAKAAKFSFNMARKDLGGKLHRYATGKDIRKEYASTVKEYKKLRKPESGYIKETQVGIKKGHPYFCNKCKDWHTKKDKLYLKHSKHLPYWESKREDFKSKREV